MSEDIRWIQRLQNWNQALSHFTQYMQKEQFNDLEISGLIHCFKTNHELAWKTQKDFLMDQGYDDLIGPKDVSLKAFEVGLVTEGGPWLDMIKSRSKIPESYQDEIAAEIADKIIDYHYSAMFELNTKLNDIA